MFGIKPTQNTIFILFLTVMTLNFNLLASPEDINKPNLLSLKSLFDLEITSATLNKTTHKETPAPVTIIEEEQISSSGARNLDELLDIFVPGFQYMPKGEAAQIGIRGTISDRNNKILMVINRRLVNIKGKAGGAIPERFMSMLGDIKQVTVIRNPGSAVYGPGAIAGIIHIETKTGDDLYG